MNINCKYPDVNLQFIYQTMSLEDLIKSGFLCGTIVGWQYDRTTEKGICSYCQRAWESYVDYQEAISRKRAEPNRREQWRLANPEEAKRYIIPEGATGQEVKRIKHAEYRKINPDIMAKHSKKRRAKKRNAEAIGDNIDESLLLKVHGKTCHICGGEINLKAPRGQGEPGWEYSLHFDHVIPLSKGGTHTIRNVKPAHGICNSMKGNKYPFYLDAMPTI